MADQLYRWILGDVAVTAILETTQAFSPALLRAVVLPDATPEALATLPWLAPHWVDEDGDLRFVTQAFLIAADGLRIVVDTCLGNNKIRSNPAFHRLETDFLRHLVRAGAAPNDVDVVLCTHLHFDHVGWNTRWDGAHWVPTFPNARYLVAEREWRHWRDQPGHAYVVADSIQPVVDAGLMDQVSMAHTISPSVSLIPTPGHTPGHVSVRIQSQGEEAIITGDMIHHPCQVAHPEWTGPADTDQAHAHRTRAAFLDDAAARGVTVLGTHFAPPAAGTVLSGPRLFAPRPPDHTIPLPARDGS